MSFPLSMVLQLLSSLDPEPITVYGHMNNARLGRAPLALLFPNISKLSFFNL